MASLGVDSGWYDDCSGAAMVKILNFEKRDLVLPTTSTLMVEVSNPVRILPVCVGVKT